MSQSKLSTILKRIRLDINNSDGIRYTELLCHQYSFEKSIQLFSTLMQVEELNELNIIVNAINSSLICMEADFEGKYTYNKFDFIVRQTQYAMNKGNFNSTLSTALDYLWNKKDIRNIIEVFELRNEDNYRLIDELLIKYFININSDYKYFFDKKQDLKKYLEELIRKYLERIEHYIKDEKLICVVLERREYTENKKLILQIMQRILKKAQIYNMDIGLHYYIPLS